MEEAGLTITEGAGADHELKWALAYADRIDPLTPWRRDIAKVKAEAAGKPCPDCGKVHNPEDEEKPADGPGPTESAGEDDAGGAAHVAGERDATDNPESDLA